MLLYFFNNCFVAHQVYHMVKYATLLMYGLPFILTKYLGARARADFCMRAHSSSLHLSLSPTKQEYIILVLIASSLVLRLAIVESNKE
jgi:uncharacterized membrane-anchored protein